MKIAMSSYSGMGAWFVLRLLAEGHKVDYFLSRPEYTDVLGGLIPSPKMLSLDHRRTVAGYGYPSYKGYDLSLFDLTGRAKQADASKQDAPTIGDGTIHCTLENDRQVGLDLMERAGMDVPPYFTFENPAEAKSFVRKYDKRYVYKPFEEGAASDDKALTYVAKDGEDMFNNIDKLFKLSKNARFLLQEFVKGTEASVAGFFNGTDFYALTCTLECKKFMNDDKGPNTGCSGNLVVAIDERAKLYQAGLQKIVPILKESGFVGMIDLNTIVTEDKAYGLEWTPRFGYLGDATFACMYGSGYGEFLRRIASYEVPEQKWAALYGMSVTFTIPPYPTEIRIPKAKDIPVEGIDSEDIQQLCSMYLYDVKKTKDGLTTSGNYGYVGATTGVGDSIEAADQKCKVLLENIKIANIQYRTDIYKNTTKRYQELVNNNWL